MLPPDNFIYFIVLFTINICCAVYLFFAYNRNWILLLNSISFVFLAMRCCTEYYLPHIESYETAYQITLIHSFFTGFPSLILWLSAWFYIRPFRNHLYEKRINKFYFGTLILIHLPIFYTYIKRNVFILNPIKIDDYWKFSTDYSSYWTYWFFSMTIFFSIVMVWLFLIDFRRSQKQRLSKLALIFIFIVFPISIYYNLMISSYEHTTYSIPNTAIFYTINILIANWFFTNYRLFSDTSNEIIGDSFNSISDLVIFTKINLDIKQFNNSAQSFFNIGESNKNLIDILSGNSRMLHSEVTPFVNQLLENFGNEKEIELEIEGEIKTMTIKAAEYLKNGILFGYTFFIKDMTELRATTKKLEDLNHIKDRIFAIIGHDLRKPAISFRGISKKVKYLIKKNDFETLYKFGESIEGNANALYNLTDNLLKWALAQKNILEINTKPINLLHITEEVFDLFREVAKDKRITLDTDISNSLCALADEGTLLTIIRNLVDNAIKYTPQGGTIQLLAQNQFDYVSFQIKDNGIGMSSNKIQDIFLLKKDKSQKGTVGEKGTGLGMYLVQELVKLNKGSISVQSELNKGTTIEIHLKPYMRRVAI